MSDSEGMSVDSGVANFRSFVALGFHSTILYSATGGIEKEIDLVTRHEGIEPENPLELPPGIYTIALHILPENPTSETKPDGTTVESYKHEKWHLEIESESKKAITDSVDITAVLNSTDKDPLDRAPSFAVMPSEETSIELGTIEFCREENLTVMLVGQIHHLFLFGDDLMFKPFKGNLKYYIQVTCNAK